MIPSNPTLIPRPFADEGVAATIPDDKQNFGEASWREGFPTETGLPLNAGGIPPRKADFNGTLKTLSQHTFFQQSGCVYPWDATINYLANSHVVGSDGNEYAAKQASGPDDAAGAQDPTLDTEATYWADVSKVIGTGGDTPTPGGGGIYNTREVLTTSGTYTAKVTGWHKITVVGGGGAGGGPFGGGQGGTTTFGSISADGGSGGGAIYSGASGGGGGGAGHITTQYIYLKKDSITFCTIGAGGKQKTSGTNGDGPLGGLCANSFCGSQGGGGSCNGCQGNSCVPLNGSYQKTSGGSGGCTPYGYGNGGGGGGSAGSGYAGTSLGGMAGPGASKGGDNGGKGGAGGPGAIILEYFDPDKATA